MSDESTPRPGFSRLRTAFDLVAAVTMFAAAALIIYTNWPAMRRPPSRPIPAEPLAIVDDASAGTDDARVVVVEYSDFQCPFCGRFGRESLPGIKRRYVDRGTVRWVFRHLPIDRLHPFARAAAESAECARKQGQFWALHDLLFNNQEALKDPSRTEHLISRLNLEPRPYSDCMTDEAPKAVVRSVEGAQTLSVTSTPTFFIGRREPRGVMVTRRLSGFVSGEEFAQALDEALGPERRLPSTVVPTLVVLGVAAVGSALWYRRKRRSSTAALERSPGG
jgi:protein-disulfide isomerase